jgi:hypothetical protein
VTPCTRFSAATGYNIRLFRFLSAPPPRHLVEDPERLGYRLSSDPLLEVMTPESWYALERAALDEAAPRDER